MGEESCRRRFRLVARIDILSYSGAPLALCGEGKRLVNVSAFRVPRDQRVWVRNLACQGIFAVGIDSIGHVTEADWEPQGVQAEGMGVCGELPRSRIANKEDCQQGRVPKRTSAKKVVRQ